MQEDAERKDIRLAIVFASGTQLPCGPRNKGSAWESPHQGTILGHETFLQTVSQKTRDSFALAHYLLCHSENNWMRYLWRSDDKQPNHAYPQWTMQRKRTTTRGSHLSSIRN